ncbi:phosphoglycerate kinase [Spiroplasma endosymbiont of Amphibalanus improvisus]|uniref:phosphoglycerate kinase n=1 Tax=Spiroplasma endosymbiont of Amphibalanus improvisus TaxID=3066327 RepID=UPI00313B2C6D
MKKTLKDYKFKNKTVLVRVDFNVPMKDGKVTNDNRVNAALPTIEYLLDNDAKVVLFSHLGKIKKEEDLKKNSLMPVAELLSKKLKKPVKFVNSIEGHELEEKINKMKPTEVVLFENTRFADITNSDGTINLEAKRESKNDSTLGKYWSSLGDIFVNDAFGTAHREHASNVGIASYIKNSCLGFLVEKEVAMLEKCINNPQSPFVAIIGGAKVSDKINVIQNLLKVADKILIGGGMAYTFFKAKGIETGNSLVEKDRIDIATELLKNSNGKIILPIDSAASASFANDKPIFSADQNIDVNLMGLDIGPKSIELFKKELEGAKTVVWNGPMGVFEFSNYAAGTKAVCKSISELAGAFTVIGGGDSAAAAIQLGFEDKFTHISTGGGASLEFMEGKILPGIDSIQNK